MANMEALWIAGCLNLDKKIVASQQAHYTHERISEVLKLPFQAIPCDSKTRMDVNALEAVLQEGDVGTVVATMGTSGSGSVDPLSDILELQAKYGFRLHADAAYGGYFTLLDNLAADTQAAFDCLGEADSIAIDPHKHGLQPFGCGYILFKDPSVGVFYKHDSPYTYFSSAELHLGEISLECSRAGASGVALWATQRLMPLVEGGEFAASIKKSRLAALALAEEIEADARFMLPFIPDLDIIIWAPRAESASKISQLSRNIFDVAATENLHLAVADFPAEMFKLIWPDVAWDRDSVTCLRSCLVKPQHHDWIDRIWHKLDEVANKVVG
jgi:glutamate/tyrosine decarboxylase-like PLP-dependent enzyme